MDIVFEKMIMTLLLALWLWLFCSMYREWWKKQRQHGYCRSRCQGETQMAICHMGMENVPAPVSAVSGYAGSPIRTLIMKGPAAGQASSVSLLANPPAITLNKRLHTGC
jgi:hypothetical protein